MQRLRHHSAKRRLDAFVDEELPAPRRKKVEYHLDECPDCAAHVRMFLAVRRSLRRMASPSDQTVARLQRPDLSEGI
jgi:anti-sigma factor RsiW